MKTKLTFIFLLCLSSISYAQSNYIQIDDAFISDFEFVGLWGNDTPNIDEIKEFIGQSNIDDDTYTYIKTCKHKKLSSLPKENIAVGDAVYSSEKGEIIPIYALEEAGDNSKFYVYLFSVNSNSIYIDSMYGTSCMYSEYGFYFPGYLTISESEIKSTDTEGSSANVNTYKVTTDLKFKKMPK